MYMVTFGNGGGIPTSKQHIAQCPQGGEVMAMSYIQPGAAKPKELWSGTWTSGSKTIPGFKDYAVFLVETNLGGFVSGIATGTDREYLSVLCGYPSSAQNYYIGTAQLSRPNGASNIITLENALYYLHTVGGGDGESSPMRIVKIVGLVKKEI